MSTLARLNGMLLAVWRGCADGQLKRLLFETDAQDVIEYALLTTFIGFAGAAAWNTMLTILGSVYGSFSGAVWDLWEPTNPVGGGS